MPPAIPINLVSPPLAALAAAFHHRGKAIRYHGQFSITRQTEFDAERLNIDFTGPRKLQLRLSAWSTDDWWFRACQRRPGRSTTWLFNHQLRGQLAPQSPDHLVQSFEASMAIPRWPPDEQLQKLHHVWRLPVNTLPQPFAQGNPLAH